MPYSYESMLVEIPSPGEMLAAMVNERGLVIVSSELPFPLGPLPPSFVAGARNEGQPAAISREASREEYLAQNAWTVVRFPGTWHTEPIGPYFYEVTFD